MKRNCTCMEDDGYPPGVDYRTDPVTLELTLYCIMCGIECETDGDIPDYSDLPILSGW